MPAPTFETSTKSWIGTYPPTAQNLNGLIVEQLEMIPDNAVSLMIGRFRLEVHSIRDQGSMTGLISEIKLDENCHQLQTA